MSNVNKFAPRNYPVRHALDLGRKHGSVVNPPRLPEMGGMTTRNADKKEGELSIRKPGGTK